MWHPYFQSEKNGYEKINNPKRIFKLQAKITAVKAKPFHYL